MADDLESIGGISIGISGDYSQLMSDLQTSQDLAANAGTEIAASLESGASGAAALTDATDQLAGSWQDTGDAAHYASQSTEELGQHVEEAGDKAHESEGAFSELSEKIVDLAVEMGVVVGAGELLKETFSAFSNVESATVALTALTGSADTAKEQIDLLEQMAADENLSFPALLEANQRMVAFGFSAEDIPGALHAAADAATALNTDISTTSNAIDRMAASGMAGARQLVALGLNTKDLADVMGVAEGDVKAAFAALDQSTRLEVLTAALGKFTGQAEAGAHTLRGEWQGVKNTFEAFFVTVGDFLEPAAKAFLTFFNTVGKAAEVFTLAVEINLEKVAFYFDKFTGQAEAANAKGLEINANAEKFRRLVSGESPEGAGTAKTGAGGATDLEGLQAKVAAELAEKEAIQGLSAAQRDLLSATQEQINFGDILKAQLSDLQGEHEKYAKTVAASGLGTDYFAKKAMPDALAAMGAAMSEAPPTVDAFESITNAVKSSNTMLDEMQGKVTPPFDALHNELSKIDADIASGNFARIQQIINRLAVDDLPTAVQQQERYVQALEGANASTQRLATAQKELLTLQMQLAQVQGESTTSYAAKLALIDVETKNLGFDTKNALGTMAAGAIQTVDADLGKVGNTLAKTALEGGGFGKVFHQIFQQMGQDLLGLVLNGLIKMGEQFVIEKLTEAAVGSATNEGEVTRAAAVGYANAFAATAAIPIIGPALAPGVAAETMASILAISPMAAFEEGGMVPETMLALVHKGEYVVPAKDVQAAGSGLSTAPGGLVISIGALHGVTRDTADALAQIIFRKARLAGAFH